MDAGAGMSSTVEIRVDELLEGPRRYTGDLDAAALELPDIDLDAVRFELAANLAGSEILVRGRLSSRARFECVKCLDRFEQEVDPGEFLRSYPLDEAGETLVLLGEIREEILLTLPAFPRCSADCAGLCPVCGTNKNRESCACGTASGDLRWSDLDGLDVT